MRLECVKVPFDERHEDGGSSGTLLVQKDCVPLYELVVNERNRLRDRVVELVKLLHEENDKVGRVLVRAEAAEAENEKLKTQIDDLYEVLERVHICPEGGRSTEGTGPDRCQCGRFERGC